MGLNERIVADLEAVGVAAGLGGPPPDVPAGDPFVTIWPDGPVRSAATMADGRGELTTVLVCHCVGLTPESVRIVEAKLADVIYALYQAVIDGQTVSFPVQDWAQPMVRDDDVSPALYDLAVEWRLRTYPAT